MEWANHASTLLEDVDEDQDEGLRPETLEFVGNGAMAPFVESGKFFDGAKASFEKKIRKLDEIRKKATEPTHPDVPVEGVTHLKEEINY